MKTKTELILEYQEHKLNGNYLKAGIARGELLDRFHVKKDELNKPPQDNSILDLFKDILK